MKPSIFDSNFSRFNLRSPSDETPPLAPPYEGGNRSKPEEGNAPLTGRQREGEQGWSVNICIG